MDRQLLSGVEFACANQICVSYLCLVILRPTVSTLAKLVDLFNEAGKSKAKRPREDDVFVLPCPSDEGFIAKSRAKTGSKEKDEC